MNKDEGSVFINKSTDPSKLVDFDTKWIRVKRYEGFQPKWIDWDDLSFQRI